MATQLNNLGSFLMYAGETDRALELLEEALRIREHALGPRHDFVATTLANIGTIRYVRNEHQSALELHERAQEIWVESLGKDHPEVAASHIDVGNDLVALRRFDEGTQHLRRALEILRDAGLMSHPGNQMAKLGLGMALLAQGKADEALEFLEQAHAKLTSQESPLGNRGSAQFHYGRALYESDTDRARGRALVLEAQKDFESAGPDFADDHAKTIGWLQKHP